MNLRMYGRKCVGAMALRHSGWLMALSLGASVGLGMLASQASAQSPLNTLYIGGNGLAAGPVNVYFDVTVNQPISITSLELNLSSVAGTACNIQVYVTAAGGTYVGNTATTAPWTLVSSGSGVSAGPGNTGGTGPHTPIDLTDFSLAPGTYGVAIQFVNGAVNYTNGNGTAVPGSGTNQTYSTAELVLRGGASQPPPVFSGGINQPRVFNGSIFYTLIGGPGACCNPNGSCQVIDLATCLAPSRGQALNSTCSGAGGTCPNPVTACCDTAGSGACTFINGTACPAGSIASGSICAPNNCSTVAGRCCAANFACTSVIQSACVGMWTAASTCAASPCYSNLASTCENLDALTAPNNPAGWVTSGSGAAGALPWAVTTTSSNSAPNSIFTNDIAALSQQLLTLPAVTAGGNLVLDLFSSSTTEAGFDGWAVEVSVNGGAFTNIGNAAWILNGYNATLPAASSNTFLANQPLFSGALAAWTQRTATIPANLGDTVVIRFDMASDISVASTGVFLDNICIYGIQIGNGACCGSTGGCTITANNNCASPNLFQGVATACNAGACPNAVSACCDNATGACTFVSGTTCTANATNHGAGTSCVPTACPASGVCCANSGGACTQIFGGTCPAGTTAGTGTVCTPTPCSPIGICCSPLGGCTQIFGGTCASGTTLGTGTVCSGNPCSAPPNVCEGMDSTATGTLPTGWTSTTTPGTVSTGGTCQPSGWTVANDQSHSSPNSAFANDPDRTFSQDLTMPAVIAGGAVTLDLWARWATENNTGTAFDGWTVEVSVNGSAFANIQPTPADPNPWVTGGYNGTISAAFNSQISGQRAFFGYSGGGTVPAWLENTAIIAANPGDSVQFKFRMVTDSSVGCPTNAPPYLGVWLDDICIYNISVPSTGVCCRGATCTTTLTSSATCSGSLFPGQTAGASFPNGATCNTGGSTTIPCCYADYNKTGGITVNDIFDFLSDWFAGSRYANTGGNGGPASLAVQNIFDFLSAWFAGGC